MTSCAGRETRKRLMTALRPHLDALSPVDISVLADIVGTTANCVRVTLTHLVQTGILVRMARCTYARADDERIKSVVLPRPPGRQRRPPDAPRLQPPAAAHGPKLGPGITMAMLMGRRA